MFNRSFISVLIVTTAFTLVFGQKPETKTDKEPLAQAFTWAFEGNGGYLGVQTQEVSKDNFAKFGLREVRGVAIEKVIEKSPAAAAGLQAGDVIVRLNGEELTSGRKLTRLISEISPDHQVKLTVLRNGSEQEITATLGKRHVPAMENGNFEFQTPMPLGKMEMPDMKVFKEFKDMPHFKDIPQMKDAPLFKDMPQWKDIPDLKDMPRDGTPFLFNFPGGEGKTFSWKAGEGRQIGVGVMPLSKQLAEHFGVEGGLMINEVREGSAAAKAGLKAGDIIVEADGKALKGDFDLIRTVNGKKEGDVTLQIVRDGKRQTISVTPEVSKEGGFFFQNGNEDGDVLMPTPAPRVKVNPQPMLSSPLPSKQLLTWTVPGRII